MMPARILYGVPERTPQNRRPCTIRPRLLGTGRHVNTEEHVDGWVVFDS